MLTIKISGGNIIMAEEKEIQEQQQPSLNPEDQNLMEEFQKLKANSVSKEEYERVLERNKELTQNWAQGRTNDQTPVDTDTVESLRKELFAEDRAELNNLESAEKILKLRQKLIDEGKQDPFVNTNSKNVDDYETAKRVADGLQHMVDEADGDPDVFNAMLGRQVDGVVSGKRKYNY